jgi:hypothetical protein
MAEQGSPGDPAADADAPTAGRWWNADIISDHNPGLPARAPLADPYGCGGLWERYTIRWILDESYFGGAGGADGGRERGRGRYRQQACVRGVVLAFVLNTHPLENVLTLASTHLCSNTPGNRGAAKVPPDDPSLSQVVSPWELYPSRTTTAAALLEEPNLLSQADTARLLSAVAGARRQQWWRVFGVTPGDDDGWEDEEGVMRAYNREVALPLGLDLLQVRKNRGCRDRIDLLSCWEMGMLIEEEASLQLECDSHDNANVYIA